jgi:sugar lactone lactonase YvrE
MVRNAISLIVVVAGCSSGPDRAMPASATDMTPATCHTDSDCMATPDRAQCQVPTGSCLVRGYPIGMRAGTTDTVALTLVFDEQSMRQPTGLSFNPARPNELWIVDHADDTVYIVTDPGTDPVTSVRKEDPDAIHFMHAPTGIAFCRPGNCEAPGMPGYFATCGENDGSQDNERGFTGPTLWTSDPAIFAEPTPSGLGSHIDMLHDTSWCMGIAHEKDNAFWVFDGGKGSLARYDFHEPHEPGGDDHSDGEIWQYNMGSFKRRSGVPSGVVYNSDDKMVYVADTGNQRIVKMDPSTATDGGPLATMEPSVPEEMDGATMTDVVPAGTLQAPSGMVLDDGLLYITDNATGRIHAFDLTGKEVRSLDTGLGAGALAGLTFGPDGKVYFVDMNTSRVYRIDPK